MTTRPTPGANDLWGAQFNAWLDETFATKMATAGPAVFGDKTSTSNLALRAAAGDGVLYVSTAGSDTNDGLSWGTAKATVQAAVNSFAPTSERGTIFLGRGTFIGATTITDHSLTIQGMGIQTKLSAAGLGAVATLTYSAVNNSMVSCILKDLAIVGSGAVGSSGLRFATTAGWEHTVFFGENLIIVDAETQVDVAGPFDGMLVNTVVEYGVGGNIGINLSTGNLVLVKPWFEGLATGASLGATASLMSFMPRFQASVTTRYSAAAGSKRIEIGGDNNAVTFDGDVALWRSGPRQIRTDAGLLLGGSDGVIVANGNLSLNGGRLQVSSGQTSGTASAGGFSLPAAPAGFLVFDIDGSPRKIPFYGA